MHFCTVFIQKCQQTIKAKWKGVAKSGKVAVIGQVWALGEWDAAERLSHCPFSLGPFRYTPKSPALQSETVHYKRGVSQQFSLPSFKIDFSEWKDDEVTSWLGPPFPWPLPKFLPLEGGKHSGACSLRFLTWLISVRNGC